MEDFEQYMMFLRVNAYEGMSGGGVFDERGYLRGIFCGAHVGENAEAGDGGMEAADGVPL